MGWLAAVPLTLLGLPAHQVSLTGTVLSFVLFLLVMPRWAVMRWSATRPWTALGVSNKGWSNRPTPATGLLRGLLIAIGLLALITCIALIGGWGRWIGHVTFSHMLNAAILCLGVGFAEELIFRSWLFEELNQFIGSRHGSVGQAILFSLVHTRFNLGLAPMSGLLVGLFLLGMVLAKRRQADWGCLWGCVGLHGGLVAGWFLLQNGLLELSSQSPAWLIGPGDSHTNPLGGVVAIGTLVLLLILQAGDSKKTIHNSFGRSKNDP